MKLNTCLFAGAALLGGGLSACSQSDAVSEIVSAPDAGGASAGRGRAIVFSTRVASELEYWDASGRAEASTRSTLYDGLFGGWTVGDAVSVSDGVLARPYEAEPGGDGTCTFTIREGEPPFTDADAAASARFYAFYPEKAVSDAEGRGGWNGSTVSAQLFAEQDYAENADGGAFGPYMASDAALLQDGRVEFTFSRVASVIEVDVSGLGEGVVPAAVSVTSNSGVSLAGLLKYDCAAQTATVSETDKTPCAASTQSDVVTVSGLPADAATVRLYVLPVQLTGGVTLTVRDTEGRFYSKTMPAGVGSAATEGLTAISGLGTAQVCTPYYIKYTFGEAADGSRPNNWMATIPGNVRLCRLSVPGAHDAATAGVTSFVSSSRTQTADIAALLAGGVRAFDLRPRYNSNTASDIELDNLELYHGPSATGVKFKDAMNTLADFVTDNPTECVYVRIKKENSKLLFEPTDQSAIWRTSVRTWLQEHRDRLVSKIVSGLTLTQGRGRLVVTTDNPYGAESNLEGTVYGGRLSWTDNTTGANTVINYISGVKVADAYVQDAYEAAEADKAPLVAAALQKASADNADRWYFNFLNLSGSPANRAKVVNPAVQAAVEELAGRTGFVFYDFCLDEDYGGGALNRAVIVQNFKYVYENRTRRASAPAGE